MATDPNNEAINYILRRTVEPANADSAELDENLLGLIEAGGISDVEAEFLLKSVLSSNQREQLAEYLTHLDLPESAEVPIAGQSIGRQRRSRQLALAACVASVLVAVVAFMVFRHGFDARIAKPTPERSAPLNESRASRIAHLRKLIADGQFRLAIRETEKLLRDPNADTNQTRTMQRLLTQAFAEHLELQLDRGQFEEVEQRVERVHAIGLTDESLENLRIQASRHIPGANSLEKYARIDQLSDYPLGGPMSYAASMSGRVTENQSAEVIRRFDVLAGTASDNRLVALNRAHAVLRGTLKEGGGVVKAIELFQEILTAHPNDPDALLGLTLARFFAAESVSDYRTCAKTFLQLLESDHQGIPDSCLKINLAFALEAANDIPAAIKAWQDALNGTTDQAVSKAVTNRIKLLRARGESDR